MSHAFGPLGCEKPIPFSPIRILLHLDKSGELGWNCSSTVRFIYGLNSYIARERVEKKTKISRTPTNISWIKTDL